MTREIDDQAAQWAAQLDAGSLSPAEDAALERWLAADPRHLGAFGKARGLMLHSARARALGPDFDPAKFGAVPAPNPIHRRLLLTGSIAASLVVTGLGLTEALHLLDAQGYATRLGETKVAVLEDGSVITLNTDTRVKVRFTKEQRTIELLQGEALFDVTKNKHRPFIVVAGNTQVRAVGTSFTVKRLPDQPVQVLVREGVVEIKRPNNPAAPAVRTAANTRAVAPDDAPIATQPVPTAEVTRQLVWRVGRVAFEGETLGEAAETFARYSDTKIVLDDPELAHHKITGLFVSNDPVGFSKAIAIAIDLKVETRNGEVHLSR